MLARAEKWLESKLPSSLSCWASAEKVVDSLGVLLGVDSDLVEESEAGEGDGVDLLALSEEPEEVTFIASAYPWNLRKPGENRPNVNSM